jgi:tRNA G37 N-methylase Trm5
MLATKGFEETKVKLHD